MIKKRIMLLRAAYKWLSYDSSQLLVVQSILRAMVSSQAIAKVKIKPVTRPMILAVTLLAVSVHVFSR